MGNGFEGGASNRYKAFHQAEKLRRLDLHRASRFTQNPLIFLGKGLDESGEAGILTKARG